MHGHAISIESDFLFAYKYIQINKINPLLLPKKSSHPCSNPNSYQSNSTFIDLENWIYRTWPFSFKTGECAPDNLNA